MLFRRARHKRLQTSSDRLVSNGAEGPIVVAFGNPVSAATASMSLQHISWRGAGFRLRRPQQRARCSAIAANHVEAANLDSGAGGCERSREGRESNADAGVRNNQ